MRILIVDDSPSLRSVIKGFVLKILPDAIISEAGDGIMAEVVLQEGFVLGEPIELIFLDWMMPRLSGRDFLANIRNIDQFKKAPDIIMLTAETYPEQVNSVIKYNVTAYVTKPFSLEDISAAIDKVLTNKKLEKAS